jgi:hypothetical protein
MLKTFSHNHSLWLWVPAFAGTTVRGTLRACDPPDHIEEPAMTDFNLPLSGAVTQTFPWTNYFTINLGQSSNPEIEREALSVASYGKQLGRIGDVVLVLLRHVDLSRMSHEEKAAVRDLEWMLHEISNKKVAHGAKLVLRP